MNVRQEIGKAAFRAGDCDHIVADHVKSSYAAEVWQQRLISDALLNNRFFAYTGMGRPQAPSLQLLEDVWIIEQRNHSQSWCLLDAGQELMFCQYPELRFSDALIDFLPRRFSQAKVITLHDPYASDWQKVTDGGRYLSFPILTTLLYLVDAKRLRSLSEKSLEIRLCRRLDRQLYRCIEGFFAETMRRRANKNEVAGTFQRNDFYGLYYKDSLLSILAKTRRIPGGQCISYVYTPTNYRGKGFARFLVSGVSRSLFESGKVNSVFLYADVTNPVSNKIYKSLGFVEICQCTTFINP